MQGNEIKAVQSAFSLPDPRELNPLQMAYLGDTLHARFQKDERRRNAQAGGQDGQRGSAGAYAGGD